MKLTTSSPISFKGKGVSPNGEASIYIQDTIVGRVLYKFRSIHTGKLLFVQFVDGALTPTEMHSVHNIVCRCCAAHYINDAGMLPLLLKIPYLKVIFSRLSLYSPKLRYICNVYGVNCYAINNSHTRI